MTSYQSKLKLLINNLYPLTFIFFFFFSVSKADISCEGLNTKINKLNLIEINFKKNRKWITNLYEKYTLSKFHEKELNSSFFLNKKYKQYFKANINFYFNDNINCTLPASIRTHGDYNDHIDYIDGNIISSLKVKLEKGNINNIVSFVLFLPDTRKGDNEIFLTNFFRELGFMAPRTTYKNVLLNTRKHKFIFQEFIGKEFIENNQKIEGPIIEGHEVFELLPNNISSPEARHEFAQKKPYLSRVSNSEWIKDSDEKFIASLNAINAMNLIYMKDPSLIKDKSEVSSVLDIDHTLLSKFENKKNNIFEALMSASNSTHGLSRDDRRFYYDSIYDEFNYIYYDGSSFILTDYKTDPDSITGKSKLGAEDAIHLIDTLDINLFKEKLRNGGIKINEYNFELIIESIVKRLEKIKKSNIKKKDYLLKKSFFNNYQNNFYKDEKLIFIDYQEIENDYKFIFTQCDIKIKNCEILDNLNLEDRKKILDLSFKNNSKERRNIYVNKSLDEYKDGSIKRKKIGIKDFKNINTNDGILIATNKYVSLKIDDENKELIINNLSWQARTVIYKSVLKNWKIKMNNSNIENMLEPKIFNKNNLTGCLTIIDSELNNVSIYADDSKCEDSVNFIRSNGLVKNISIKNSIRDALDADFSNLYFENIYIKNSFNDCLDFSYGDYNLKNVEVDNCSDKGISVGEKSEFKAVNVIIKNSDTGIASKDSSNTSIENLKIFQTKTCLAAYKKKQEFDGGYLNVNKFNCDYYQKKINKDLFSSILINNQ
jgi:hypothetical protein